MAKSDKATVLARVQDVVRLVLAGAEFGDIRQYAADRNWQVSERQLRRYQDRAYRRLARDSTRDRKQLLGRHLSQRRALYARAIKGNDVRTALQVLRDEAALQGLYPPTKIAPTTPDGEHPYQPAGGQPSVPRINRVVRLLNAEAADNQSERQLLATLTPYKLYRSPDTALPIQSLQISALMFVGEQLEHAAAFLHAQGCTQRYDDADGQWELMRKLSAYQYKVGLDAWRIFTSELGIDGDYLVSGNYRGPMLEVCNEAIPPHAPEFSELESLLLSAGSSAEYVVTPESQAKSWHRLFEKACATSHD